MHEFHVIDTTVKPTAPEEEEVVDTLETEKAAETAKAATAAEAVEASKLANYLSVLAGLGIAAGETLTDYGRDAYEKTSQLVSAVGEMWSSLGPVDNPYDDERVQAVV